MAASISSFRAPLPHNFCLRILFAFERVFCPFCDARLWRPRRSIVALLFSLSLALFQLVPHSGPVSSRSIDFSSAASIFEGRSREVGREGREKTKKALVLYSVSCFVYPTSPAPLGVNSGKRDREPFEGESGRKRVLVE